MSGQSSGGLTVEMLAMAYSGQHTMFNTGITSSITLFSPFWATIAAEQSLYTELLNVTGCEYENDSMQCLRERTWSLPPITFPHDHPTQTTLTSLIHHLTFHPRPVDLATFNTSVLSITGSGKGWRPIVDGDFLKNSPHHQFAHSQIARIPLLVGCNTDEGMSTFQTAANTSTQLAASLQTTMGLSPTMAQELLALYPDDPSEPYPPYSQPTTLDWAALADATGRPSGTMTRRGYAMGGDWSAMSGRRLTASRWGEATGGAPVYSYRFDTDVHRFPLSSQGPGFSQHGADLSFDFGLPYAPYTGNWPVANVSALRSVSYAIRATWVSFAATGSPNYHGLEWIPEWPEYAESKQNMVWNGTLDNVLNIHVEDDTFRQDQIGWWMDHWGYLLLKGFPV